MKIDVIRLESDDEATLSLVTVDGHFIGYGLEDQRRDGPKVPGETRIPAGTYRVGVRVWGGFHQRYARRFPDIHRGMLHVEDVPGFTSILIHVGNTDDDTAGCLLIGRTRADRGQPVYVGESVAAYRQLYAATIDAAAEGRLSIRYHDLDREG